MLYSTFANQVKALAPNATEGRIFWAHSMGFSPEYAANWMEEREPESDDVCYGCSETFPTDELDEEGYCPSCADKAAERRGEYQDCDRND